MEQARGGAVVRWLSVALLIAGVGGIASGIALHDWVGDGLVLLCCASAVINLVVVQRRRRERIETTADRA